MTVSYTHLRAHETGRNLVCRLLLEKKNYGTWREEQHYVVVRVIVAEGYRIPIIIGDS